MVPKTLLFASALLLSQQAIACEARLADIVKRAYPGAVVNEPASSDDERSFDLPGTNPVRVRMVGDVACKIWPAHPELTLVTVVQTHLPLVQQDKAADVEILVVDTGTGKVMQRMREENLLDSDAERASLQGLDTARYALNPGTLVFGVRTRRVSGAYAWSSTNEALRLYAIKGAQLVRILELEIAQEHNRGKAMTERPHKHGCGDNERIVRTIATGSGQHLGFNELIVQTTSTVSLCYEQKDDEEKWVVDSRRQSSQRYVYNGESYVAQGKATVGARK
jgi:hypothetical protein